HHHGHGSSGLPGERPVLVSRLLLRALHALPHARAVGVEAAAVLAVARRPYAPSRAVSSPEEPLSRGRSGRFHAPPGGALSRRRRRVAGLAEPADPRGALAGAAPGPLRARRVRVRAVPRRVEPPAQPVPRRRELARALRVVPPEAPLPL